MEAHSVGDVWGRDCQSRMTLKQNGAGGHCHQEADLHHTVFLGGKSNI